MPRIAKVGLRLKHAIKPAKETKDFKYERLLITLPKQNQHSELAGIKVGYKPPLSIYLLPQLGFLLKNSVDYNYFTLSELRNEKHLDCFHLYREDDAKMIFNNDSEKDDLIHYLKELKIQLNIKNIFNCRSSYLPFLTKSRALFLIIFLVMLSNSFKVSLLSTAVYLIKAFGYDKIRMF